MMVAPIWPPGSLYLYSFIKLGMDEMYKDINLFDSNDGCAHLASWSPLLWDWQQLCRGNSLSTPCLTFRIFSSSQLIFSWNFHLPLNSSFFKLFSTISAGATPCLTFRIFSIRLFQYFNFHFLFFSKFQLIHIQNYR